MDDPTNAASPGFMAIVRKELTRLHWIIPLNFDNPLKAAEI